MYFYKPAANDWKMKQNPFVIMSTIWNRNAFNRRYSRPSTLKAIKISVMEFKDNSKKNGNIYYVPWLADQYFSDADHWITLCQS